LYASSILLSKKIAIDKALEFAEAAVGNSDATIAVPNANSFVMASELYDSRQIAFGRGELVKVPEVPRQTLAAILRGRIEDLIGWGLMQKDRPAEATIRFKRAVAILPEKSAWWRAGMWRLGSALQADGKEQEALDSYIKSYSIDKPDLARYTTVEALYKKLNGSTDGLEAKIGAIPLAQIAPPVVPKTETTPAPRATEEPKPQPSIAEPTPTPQSSKSAEPVTAEPTPTELKVLDIKPVTATTDSELPPAKIEPASSPIPVTETPVTAVPTATPTPEVVPSPTPVAASTAVSSPTPLVEESPKPEQPKP
jgi:tetratricopeptide (TPR) repeat protein